MSKYAFAGTLHKNLPRIPEEIIPGPKPTTRCCIYKERAIVNERIKLALGGNPDNPNVVEVINIACDECPVAGYKVTDSCRGCIAHRCEVACKFGAIVDKSYILDVIEMLKNKEDVFAIVAPAIAAQFSKATLGQVITGIKKLGFSHVVEAALGADLIACHEALELVEKEF